MKNAQRQKGSVVTYILLAIFLCGILVMSMTEGPKKSAQTQQLDELGVLLKADIETVEAAVNDCVLIYPLGLDRNADGTLDTTDNPNAPFPLLYDSTTGYATTGLLDQAICPGTPPAPLSPPTAASNQQLLINAQKGRALRLLSNAALYTATMTSDTTEGVYLRVTRASANALWTEALPRLDDRFSECKAAVVTAPGACVDGCFYYWIKRLTTSTIGLPEAGCTL